MILNRFSSAETPVAGKVGNFADVASQSRMQANNILTVNFIFFPLKANTWRFKNIACNRNEPKQCINTWQITEVSNSTKRHADNSGNQVDL